MKKISLPTSIPEKPTFRGFEIENPHIIPGYKRNLPHLRIEGATYFITFRLADSIPTQVMKEWIDERDRWYAKYGLNKILLINNPEIWYKAYYAIHTAERLAFELLQRRRYF